MDNKIEQLHTKKTDGKQQPAFGLKDILKYKGFLQEGNFGKIRPSELDADGNFIIKGIAYHETVYQFIYSVHKFVEEYKNGAAKAFYCSGKTKYLKLEKLSEWDDVTTVAAILAIVRAERFGDGILLANLKNGTVLKLVEHLECFEKQTS